MGEYKPSTCRSCGSRVMWVKTAKGGNMPINYDEALEHEFVGTKGQVPDFDATRMESHFATCPHADDHRRK